MNDQEKDNEFEESLKLFEKNRAFGNNTSVIHRTQAGQTQSTRRTVSIPNSASRQNSGHSSEHPVRRTQLMRKHRMYLSLKRKAAEKRRQHRLTIITAILAAVMILSIVLIVKSCSGGDVLKGTWDLDGVTVYQFDGNGHGSLNLPSNTYPFTYEIKDNELSIDFESNAARDITYTFTVEKDRLVLVRNEDQGIVTYELKRQKNIVHDNP